MIKGKVWVLLAVLAVIFAAMLALRPVLPIDETRYLAVAWEMWLSGDPVHLTKNFSFYTHKPPLLFWLINLIWLVSGVSELAGRALGPVLAIAVVFSTNLLAKRFWPELKDIGFHAAVIVAGFTVFLLYGSATMFDCLLALPVLLGVAALWAVGSGQNTWPNWVLFGLALAIGVLAKGPVIFVHLMPLVLTLPVWAKQAPVYRTVWKGFALAIVVALAFVALWLAPALITGSPEFRTELLWTQSAGRVAGGLAHDRPFWFLAALLPAILFPWGWSLRSWSGLRANWKSDPALRFCVIWAVSALVLFSLISGKQVHYLIPAFPAISMVFARAASASETPARTLVWLPLVLLGGVFVAIGSGLAPANGDLIALSPFWPSLVLGAVCFGLAYLCWRLDFLPGHALAGVGLALGLHGLVYSTALYQIYEGKALADLVLQHAADGIAVTNLEYNAEFNFAARLTAPVALPQSKAEVLEWAKAHPAGIVLGRISESPLTIAPKETIKYIGQDWGYWPSALIISQE